ncbi:MAG: Uncharacterized protein Greene041619_692 [Candidatus Peregrinibacteria bacterium Greene0416_19]|nr:MAG: Uncharacterized protein Greene041619_692 [Candidatus Peregrinibacteria bacterium Greene0416_19]
MSLTLSWDLFIIVFFAIVVTYTFIIGKKESVKIMLSSYIAIVAVQGFGNLLQRLTGSADSMLSVVGVTIDLTILSTTKLVLFIAIIVFLAVRAGFDVKYDREPNQMISLAITGLFGFATAGLLLSTLLTYIAGVPLLDATVATASTLAPIVQQSELMKLMVVNQDLWFSLPAVLLIGVGMMTKA